MEEKNNNGIDVVNTEQELTEVKSYKKADDKLINGVLIGLAAVMMGILIYCNVNGIRLFRKNETPDEQPEKKIEEVQKGSTYSYAGTQTVQPTVQPTEQQTVQPTEQPKKEEEKKAEKTEEKKDETTVKTPEEIEKAWVTEELPKEETITFAYYDAAEEKEDKLTKADKAYIQEYIDYYGISYEDARVTYLQYGPLVVPYEHEEPTKSDEPEYQTKYVFDDEDLATINTLMKELGYTRSEAETVYITEIAPALGKPIKTEIVMLVK